MDPPPTFPALIETARLLIRPPRPGDGADVNAAIAETFDNLHRWIAWARCLPSVEESEERCRQAYAAFLAGEDIPLYVYRKDDGTFVAASGLHPRGRDVPKFEIGYWCRTSAQGHGYVTEAVRAITRVGFETMGANRVEIRCDPRNVPSRRVAERAGYRLEGELRNEQRAPDGGLRNTLVFARLPHEFVGGEG